MHNVFMICNTPYQIFVASWLKTTVFNEDSVDILISDHMNSGNRLAENAAKTDLFCNVFYAEIKNILPYRLDFFSKVIRRIDDLYAYKTDFKIQKKYDILCVANLDKFTQLVYDSIVNDKANCFRNSLLKLYLFEDGVATYSKLMPEYIDSCGKTSINRFFGRKKIRNNIDGIYAFEKEAFVWQPKMPIYVIDKIDEKNVDFRKSVNCIFDYDTMHDQYEQKYIFMEESFYADGFCVNDVEIIEAVAEIVGKENIMIKIHPRNPVNRFKELGYKTNENTYIPWEAIILNQNMNDKILLTFASSSVINPLRLFGKKTKVYSLYNYLDRIPETLDGPLWEATLLAFQCRHPDVVICEGNMKKFLKELI